MGQKAFTDCRPPRQMFVDQATRVTANGVMLEPEDKSNADADARLAKCGGVRVIAADARPTLKKTVEKIEKGKVGRPSIGKPWEADGITRSAWYRRKAEREGKK
jgi:hypothetical protein